MNTDKAPFQIYWKFLNLKNTIAFVLSPGIVFGALLNDQDHYLIGWDTPKVSFWMSLSAFLIFIMLVHQIFGIVSKIRMREKIEFDKGLIFLIPTVILFLISTLRVDLTRTLDISGSIEPSNDSSENINYFYRIIFSSISWIVDLSQSEDINQALIGNKYRDQGVILFLLLVIFLFFYRKYISRNVTKILFAGFILSGVVQTTYTIFEYYHYETYFSDLSKSGFLYGTFGQPNFYAGHLLVGLFASTYFMRNKDKLVRILAILSFLFTFFGIAMSESTWTYIVMGLSFVLLAVREYLNKDFVKRISIPAIFSSAFILPIAASIFLERFEIYKFRYEVWDAIYLIFIKAPLIGDLPLSTLFFGGGFGMLAENFEKYGFGFLGYTDMAHNLYLEILAATGIITFGVFITLVIYTVVKLFKYIEDDLIFTILLVFSALVMRNLIHTSSVVNLIDFVIIWAVALGFITSSSTKETRKGPYL